MTTSLIIQTTYECCEVGIFNNTDLIASCKIDKLRVSADLIPEINTLLSDNNLKLNDLSCIGINKGPGPFSTLRVIIATVNGLSFGTGIPLIGIDGLHALLLENSSSDFPLTVALLNAYNNDVYYGFDAQTEFSLRQLEAQPITTDRLSENKENKPAEHNLMTGCKNIELFLNELVAQFPGKTIRFIGQGTTVFAQQIRTIVGAQAYIPEPPLHNCTLEQLARMAHHAYVHKSCLSTQIHPIYLKALTYKKAGE